jgi:hypothetical protein
MAQRLAACPRCYATKGVQIVCDPRHSGSLG